MDRDSKGQFTKGNSYAGQSPGRPKGIKQIPGILRKIGEEEGTQSGKYTKLEVVMKKVFDYALQGKPWAVQFIADRTEGKAVEHVVTEEYGKDEVIVE